MSDFTTELYSDKNLVLSGILDGMLDKRMSRQELAYIRGYAHGKETKSNLNLATNKLDKLINTKC
jgi:hypothetical protein